MIEILGGIFLKLVKEIAYQCLILVTILGLIFVAFDMSEPAAAVKVFSPTTKVLENMDDEAEELFEANTDYFKNILLPFVVYLLACGGFVFLILENIRLWKTMHSLKPIHKLFWTFWVVLLGLMSLLPIYLGTSLFSEGLWYIFLIAAILSLFCWVQWASQN